jgi:hypothetical protein
MADADIGFKIAAHFSGREMSSLAGIQAEVWEPIGDTLQTTERLADRAFRAQQGEDRFVVYFEAYKTWNEDARGNILAKSGLLSERERLPTRTLVFVLTRPRYRPQHGTFRLAAGGHPTQQIWFEEIRLWEEQPKPEWEQVPGLMALLPLCAHGLKEEDAILTAARGITANVADTSARADLLASLALFGNLAYPTMEVVNLIGVENMRESKFFEDVMALGREEGKLQSRRADILEVLEARFGPEKASKLRKSIEAVKDGAKLLQLVRTAATSESLTEFRRALRAPAP